MSLPWLDQPVMLHSSRDSGKCSMTPEQCAYKTQYWVFWYEADHRYALPTTAFFLAVIIFVSVGNFAALYMPSKVRRHPLWLRLLSFCRFLSYKSWTLGSWNTQSLAVYILAAIVIIFFAAMTLGPRPYYWPNTKEVSFGSSPPIATRAGYMALACMPFLFVLGAKSNPISTLTGISHEKLNVWHNWVAWAMFVLALVHTFPFIIFHIWKGDIVKSWNDGGIWVTGVIALLAQAWLTFMSIRWIRDRYYEIFKATHFIAAAVFFIFFFIHCDFRLTSWDYFIATAVLYSLCWFLSQIRTYMEHGLNHATLSLETPNSLKVAIETNTRWTPGQHVYLRFLTGSVHALTAHPFTIASVSQHERRSQMVFYIRPRGGTTGRLAKMAAKSPGMSMPVLLDGPYGGVTSRWFLGFDRTLVVAGGAGAGFSLPIIEHFLKSHAKGSELTVVVASHDSGFRSWYLQVLNDIAGRQAISENDKDMHISVLVHETGPSQSVPASSLDDRTLKNGDGKEVTESTSTSFNEEQITIGAIHVRTLVGRPDIASIAQETTEKQGTVGMMVCGPASMVFDLRRSATAAQTAIINGKLGANEVWFYNESFSF